MKTTIVLLFIAQIFSKYAITLNSTKIKTNDDDELFVYKICSFVLKETEWKYMSVIIFDTKKMELSKNFMKRFHDEVGPVILTYSEMTEPTSRATLLIYGNIKELYSTLSKKVKIWAADVFYIILINEFVINYDKIFKDLWQNHRIKNALLISFKEPGKVISYNPFFDRLNVVDWNVSSLNETLNKIRKITRKKMSNLNGHPIRVTMFPTRLKAVPQADGTYIGSDGIILQMLAKRMNFTPIITVPPDGHKYGWKEKNGTFTGAIGEIVNGRADIAFNGVFIKHYHSDDIQFTTPVHFDQVCFVVPKALPKAKWKTVLFAFDLSIWICSLITYGISLLIWYIVKNYLENNFDITLLCVNLYRIFLMMPINGIRPHCSERIIVLATVFFSFVLASSFQGSMIKFLTYEITEQDMSKIEELAVSRLNIMSASLNLKELFETDENPVMIKLLAKFSWTENKDILGEIATKKNAAAIGRKSDIEAKITTSYVKGNHILLHIMEECPRSYYIAYLVPKKSPYITVFNDLINYYVEAGITKSWFIHSKPFRPLSDYHASVKQSHIVFTIENVIFTFVILIFGLGLSGLVFLTEFIVYRYRKKFSITIKTYRNWRRT